MSQPVLRRELGVIQATGLGLGSILGTGVFVGIGLAAEFTGGWVVLATALAGLLATANALSSAQLAAAHPVSGGTYEYGTLLLGPAAGFAAGWMFLCAKGASAATAALGFAGYALGLAGVDHGWARTLLASIAVVTLTALVLTGLRRSSVVNTLVVTVTIAALGGLVMAAVWRVPERFNAASLGWDEAPGPGLLHSTALMFVAFTGYGRVATMGEEVRDPTRTIPRAIVATLVASAVIYIIVATTAVAVLGGAGLASTTARTGAPLEDAARLLGVPGLPTLVALGAMTAMLGVLLNLILGLSRVLLAMGRRGDAPPLFARVSRGGHAPARATVGVGLAVLAVTAVGSIRLAWSFSAFTVLVYYTVTNLAALRLPRDRRRYPTWIAWSGLAGCVGLAWWVEVRVWVAGLLVLAVGFALRRLCRRWSAPSSAAT